MTDFDREKRRFSRISFDTHTTIVEPEHSWISQLLDISLKGALVTRPRDWHGTVGDCFNLKVGLGDNTDTVITMNVRVAHIEGDRIGCECLDIDMDSISHLKRLLELNLGDAELLERELSALWQEKDIP